MLKNSAFFAELEPEEREQKVDELLSGVDFIANMGIGSRAIFNVSLYGALGTQLARHNSNPDLAIMWPLEEDSDRWGIDVMQRVWEKFSERASKMPTIPCVYPNKELRQPFSRAI